MSEADILISGGIWLLLEEMKQAKPDDRSEKARRYAVTITEFEKVAAYFKTYVIDEQC